jgi:hypothetical protein
MPGNIPPRDIGFVQPAEMLIDKPHMPDNQRLIIPPAIYAPSQEQLARVRKKKMMRSSIMNDKLNFTQATATSLILGRRDAHRQSGASIFSLISRVDLVRSRSSCDPPNGGSRPASKGMRGNGGPLHQQVAVEIRTQAGMRGAEHDYRCVLGAINTCSVLYGKLR